MSCIMMIVKLNMAMSCIMMTKIEHGNELHYDDCKIEYGNELHYDD
jgi:hypothetical protein